MNKALFVLVVALSAAALVAGAEFEKKENDCDFACWVKALEITIDKEISFNEKFKIILIEHRIAGTISSLTVNNLELGEIVSKYPAPNTGKNNSFYLEVNIKTAHAHGSWTGDSDLGSCYGTAYIDLENIVLGMTMIFNKNETEGPIEGVYLIDNVDAKDCKFKMDIKDLRIEFEKTSGFIGAISKLFGGNEAFSNLVQSIVKSLKGTINDVIPGFICPLLEGMIEENVTDLFHQANNMIYEFWAENKPLDIPVIEEEMVDLHISPIIDTARFLFEKFIGVNGPFNLSYIVDIFSKNTGILRLSELYPEALEFSFYIEKLNATLTLGIDDLVLEGLKTWNEFSLLEPVNGSNVNLFSHTNLTTLAITLTWHIIVEVDGDMISVGGAKLEEHATFYVKLNNNIMDFYLQLSSYDGLAQNYSNRMCTNVTCMEALISPDSTGITYFTLHMEFENISLYADKGDLEEDVRALINNVVGMFVDNYKLAIPPFVNGLVMTLLPMLNDLLSGLLVDAYCEDDPDPEFIEVDVPVTVGSVGGASVLTALLMILPCTGLVMKKKRVPDEEEAEGAEMNDLAHTYVEGADMPPAKKEKNKDNKYLFSSCHNQCLRTDVKGASMFFDPRLNLSVRVIIPLLLFCTIAIFLSANTGVGASVFVVMTLGSARDVTLPSLFDFGLINTIEDMWTAEVYPLSILVAVFSGIWPYLKVVLMILAWFLPKKIFSEKSRGSLLEWLDILGKWSLLDTYIMIMMLVAFHFNIQFPIVNTADITKPTAVQIFVYPAYGFLALILGTLASLLMSHVLLGLHRYIQPDDHMNDCDDAQRARPMISYAACSKSPTLRLVTRIGLSVGLGVSMIMMILGTCLNTFSFDFVGLVGWLLPMLEIDPHRAYSVLSLTEEVPPSAQNPNSFTVRFTQIVFIMTAFIFPVLHIASMLVLWLVPLKRKIQHYLNYACEVLSAWSCVDVFIISIIAACLEIRQFAGFMVGDKCDFLKPILEDYFGDFVGEYKSCFEVLATLESGCYVLFIGTIIYTAVYMTFNRVVLAALRTRGNNGIPMTDEQVKEIENRGRNKRKFWQKKPAQATADPAASQPQAFGEVNTSNAFVGGNGIAVSNKSFVASVSTLSIAASPSDAYGQEEEVEEDEDSDSSVDDLEAPPPVAPAPPSCDPTV